MARSGSLPPPPPPTAAGRGPDQLGGGDGSALGGQRHQRHPAAVRAAAEDDGLQAAGLAHLVGQLLQLVRRQAVDPGDQPAVDGLVDQGPRLARQRRLLGLPEPALDLPQIGQLALDRRRHLVRGGPEQAGRVGELAFDLAKPGQRGGAGGGEDAAQVGADRSLRDDLERTDLAQPGHVGAAAELERLVAGLHDPDLVAVLLLEEGDGPGPLGVVLGITVSTTTSSSARISLVDQILDAGDLVRTSAARSG